MPISPEDVMEKQAALRSVLENIEREMDAKILRDYKPGACVEVPMDVLVAPDVVEQIGLDYAMSGWDVVYRENPTGTEVGSRFLVTKLHHSAAKPKP